MMNKLLYQMLMRKNMINEKNTKKLFAVYLGGRADGC